MTQPATRRLVTQQALTDALAGFTPSGGGGSGLDPTTFLYVSNTGGGAIAPTSFSTVPLPVVDNDPGGHYDATNFQYVVPDNGTYLILARFRIVDGTNGNANIGMGVHVDNSDGPWFQWQGRGAGARYTENYQRIGFFVTGDRLRLFVYLDGGDSNGVNQAALAIVRLF